jgi:beta-N-acetylhexosaminidase
MDFAISIASGSRPGFRPRYADAMIRRLIPIGVAVLLSALSAAVFVGACAVGGSGPVSSLEPTAEVVATTTTTSEPPLETTTTTTLSEVEILLRGMTLEQKAAQVLLMSISGTSLSAVLQAFITEHPPGGVLILKSNVSSAAQLKRFTSGLQEAARDASSVGMLVAVDQEGGTVQRIGYGVPDVPSARSLGQNATLEEAAALAAETAGGLLSLGVNMNLAPVADVVAERASFLYGRSYGADPGTVSSFVTAVVGAYEGAGLISTVKHFPGHGSATGNTHGEVVVTDADRESLATTHLPPFEAAITAGVEAVMVAHVVVNAYDADNPASRSSAIIEGLLREELGFEGLVVADDIRMAGAAEPSDTSSTGSGTGTTSGPDADRAVVAVGCLSAGCDLLISTGTLLDQQALITGIVAAVNGGNLAESRLDEAVLRILEVKLRHPTPAPRSERRSWVGAYSPLPFHP